MEDNETSPSSLIAGAERSDRRNLTVIGVVSAMVFAVFLLWSASDGPTDDNEALPPDPLAVQIQLAATTVSSGGTIDGQVVVTNNTGGNIKAIGCGALFQVALASDDYEPAPSWTMCAREFSFPTGESTYPVTVAAHHLECTADPSANADQVRCDENGNMPSLPPGDYEARLYQGYEGQPMPEPTAVPVEVLPGP